MMPDKATAPPPSPEVPDPISALRPLAPIAWMSTAWVESLADLGTEVTSFVAERIREDVKTQHAILHCKSMAELQHVQAQFVQRALDQYVAETGKLVEMSGKITAKIRNGGQTDS
jgi:hypothetical protein